MSPVYWTWWEGALALGAITSGSWFLIRRPLSASGLVGRTVDLRRERAACGGAADADESLLREALVRATAEEFGDLAGALPPPPSTGSRGRPLGRALSTVEVLIFLGCLAAGGFLARLQTGAPPDLSPDFVRTFGDGWRARSALMAGGALVGAGTSLAQGCSIGHGLAGLSRLQPASLAVMGIYVVTGTLVALLVGALG